MVLNSNLDKYDSFVQACRNNLRLLEHRLFNIDFSDAERIREFVKTKDISVSFPNNKTITFNLKDQDMINYKNIYRILSILKTQQPQQHQPVARQMNTHLAHIKDHDTHWQEQTECVYQFSSNGSGIFDSKTLQSDQQGNRQQNESYLKGMFNSGNHVDSDATNTTKHEYFAPPGLEKVSRFTAFSNVCTCRPRFTSPLSFPENYYESISSDYVCTARYSQPIGFIGKVFPKKTYNEDYNFKRKCSLHQLPKRKRKNRRKDKMNLRRHVLKRNAIDYLLKTYCS